MILLFVLRSFRVGIELKYEELIQVNERRRSEKRSHYVEKSAAMKIYGSNQKNIKDKLTLVQFSDLGINEEDFWNNFHMVLQIEDLIDVLSCCTSTAVGI